MAQFDDENSRERIDPREAAQGAAREWREIASLLRIGIRAQVEIAAPLADPSSLLDFARAVGVAMSVEHAAILFEKDAERGLDKPSYEY